MEQERWSPIDAAVLADPPAAYASLRERCPVARSEAWGGFWVLTRYDDIVSVASDSDGFTTSVQNLVPATPRNGLPRRPLQVDPPEHAHFRRAMNPYFEEATITHLEPVLRATARRLAAPVAAAGRTEAMSAFAEKLPIRMLCAFLNTGESDADAIQVISSAYVRAIADNDRERARMLSGELDAYAAQLVATRRVHPLDGAKDLISGMLRSGVGGEAVSDDVMAGFVRGLLVAADRSTANGIGSALLHLAKDPSLQDRLRREPGLIPAAVEEFLRLYAPSQATARTAREDTVVGGQEIAAGDVVAMVFLAGNRDPEMFAEPDRCVLDRSQPTRHLGFGHGVHKCPGQHLARMQLRVALEEFLGATRVFALAGTVTMNRWPEYGPRTLPLRFAAR